MGKSALSTNQEGLARWALILIIVLSVLVVGGVGYYIGWNRAEDQAKSKYSKQTQELQQELDKAKQSATTKVTAGQEKVAEGQQTVESLSAENTQLKSTIETQNQKIADLEKQLEDAQKPTGTTNQ